MSSSGEQFPAFKSSATPVTNERSLPAARGSAGNARNPVVTQRDGRHRVLVTGGKAVYSIQDPKKASTSATAKQDAPQRAQASSSKLNEEDSSDFEILGESVEHLIISPRQNGPPIPSLPEAKNGDSGRADPRKRKSISRVVKNFVSKSARPPYEYELRDEHGQKTRAPRGEIPMPPFEYESDSQAGSGTLERKDGRDNSQEEEEKPVDKLKSVKEAAKLVVGVILGPGSLRY